MTVQQRRRNGRRVWTDTMNSDLLDCKKKALELAGSTNPPRYENGKKRGYMCLMKELWENKGYGNLELTRQNLRDQAAKLEKTLGSVSEAFSNRPRTRNQQENQNFDRITDESSTTEINLHNSQTQNANESEEIQEQSESIDHERSQLLERSKLLFVTVKSELGNFKKREIDTRTKEKITVKDLEIVNEVTDQLMKQSQHNPKESPFEYLWTSSCALYSTVATFLLWRGWKKPPCEQPMEKKNKEQVEKEIYQRKATAIRKKLSIATAELERIKENKKITKRGKRNRIALQEECKTISVVTLITYNEKKKSELRKLKSRFYRKKKVDETRKFNKMFTTDPKKVYESFREMTNKDVQDGKLPTYQRLEPNYNEGNSHVFENVEQASGFWRELWEQNGSGNPEAEWLHEIKTLISAQIPTSRNDVVSLTVEQITKALKRKRNWSSPGPDRIVNFWWKKAHVLHKGVAQAFQALLQSQHAFPSWFAEGKTTLIPKSGEFSSNNQRPITCLNTVYKWFTSCLLEPIDAHLDKYDLMELEQRGAKRGCSGTIDNLMIDRMVLQDSQRNKRNVSMAWLDVKKAYDSIHHGWLNKIMLVHRFPKRLADVIRRLSATWNTRITARTTQGQEQSDIIRFRRGLPQGDALCPRLFTLCLNPVAWMLKATEGYRMSKPIRDSVTHLLYVDDLKVFAASSTKLNTVLRSTVTAMKDVGLQVNPKKCSTINVKRGAQVLDENNAKVDEITVLQNLKDGEHYKFLGILETMKQEDRLVLDQAIKVFLSRMSVIWSSPLSDHNRVIASNQFALPAMSYQMWTQQWPVADLKQVDREVRKIISSNGGNHPLSSTALLYLPRDLGGRGLRSVESTYKECKIKGAIKLYQTTDPKMETVRSFEEQALKRGHKSVIKDAARFAKEYDLTISLEHPEPTCCLENGTKVNNAKIGDSLKSQRIEQLMNTIRDQKWQGKLIAHRWDDDSLRVKNCFAWLSNWTSCPTHTIAGMSELYEQMLPTRVYYGKKVGSQQETTMTCRMCHSKMETVQHVLSGCSAIAQSKYLWRHNAALKIVFFESLKDLDLIEETPPWYSPKQPKAKYESSNAEVYWDVPVWAESTELSANRIDARIINHEAKTVSLLEMSCPWVENRGKKDLEKTTKYAPMRWEMKQRYPGYSVEQHNIIVDVLGGWSKDVEKTIQKLTGKKARFVMEKIQKSVISNTLNIARTFKIQC